jgi:hypothetical protein
MASIRALLGMDGPKPFECVGTHAELMAGLFLSIKRRRSACDPLPPLLQEVEREILAPAENLEELSASILSAWTDRHYLPAECATLFKRQLAEVYEAG